MTPFFFSSPLLSLSNLDRKELYSFFLQCMEYEENNKSNNNNGGEEEEDPRMKVNEKTFNWVDRNKDGNLTLYELVAAAMNKTMLSLNRYILNQSINQ